jgi:four helix bundle protein
MSGNYARPFTELEVYQRYEELSEILWDIADTWTRKTHLSVGDQTLRAVDSIGANIAEAVGRGHHKECLHHLYYARGSLLETQHWIRLVVRRKLIHEETVQRLRNVSGVLHKQLNAFIRSQRPRRKDELTIDKVSEEVVVYGRSRRQKRKHQEPRAKSQEPNHV